MSKAPTIDDIVVNSAAAPEHSHLEGFHMGSHYRVLTPAIDAAGGKLGVNLTRVPPGRTTCPFHFHQLEDEVFYVLSGKGVLRYGEALRDIGPGDCIACPAGVQTAHQIANPYEDDLVYLAIGPNEPQEVCVYPDDDLVYLRGLKRRGRLGNAPSDGPSNGTPEIFRLIAEREGS